MGYVEFVHFGLEDVGGGGGGSLRKLTARALTSRVSRRVWTAIPLIISHINGAYLFWMNVSRIPISCK